MQGSSESRVFFYVFLCFFSNFLFTLFTDFCFSSRGLGVSQKTLGSCQKCLKEIPKQASCREIIISSFIFEAPLRSITSSACLACLTSFSSIQRKNQNLPLFTNALLSKLRSFQKLQQCQRFYFKACCTFYRISYSNTLLL